MREKVKNLAEKCIEIIKVHEFVNDDGGIEIYTDYRDRELSTKTLTDIMESENPREYFEDMLSQQALKYAFDYGYDELEEEIRKDLTDEENALLTEDSDEIWDYIIENIYFYYDFSDFNAVLKVNIMIDCGNGNYDYACDNVLNYCGSGEFDGESSILWLAEAQGKADKLRKVCKIPCGEDEEREIQSDKFIESCVQELENLTFHMGTVTFLVKMNLFQLFDLLEIQKAEYMPEGEYDPRKNTKSKSTITLDKTTMCGLYDPWNGAGSVLEIELDKDVEIPIKYCVFCVDGCKMYGRYDIDEVYGLIESCWKETLKTTTKEVQGK
jgi:hypothetical protein